MRTLIIGILLTACWTGSILQAQESSEFSSADGFKLQATTWFQKNSAPAVLLLHQCDADQSMYNKLADLLYAKGFHVMTYDHRGIGKSVSPEYDIKKADNKSNEWSKVLKHNHQDLDAAMNHLKLSLDSRFESISLFGASCSGEKVLYLSKINQEKLKAIGILSSRMSAGLREEFNEFSNVPGIFIAAEGDIRAYETAIRAKEISKAPNSRLITYKGRQHAKALFSRDKKLESTIADWFASVLND